MRITPAADAIDTGTQLATQMSSTLWAMQGRYTQGWLQVVDTNNNQMNCDPAHDELGTCRHLPETFHTVLHIQLSCWFLFDKMSESFRDVCSKSECACSTHHSDHLCSNHIASQTIDCLSFIHFSGSVGSCQKPELAQVQVASLQL